MSASSFEGNRHRLFWYRGCHIKRCVTAIRAAPERRPTHVLPPRCFCCLKTWFHCMLLVSTTFYLVGKGGLVLLLFTKFHCFFFLGTPRFRKFILSILLSLYFFRNYWVLSHQMSCIAKEKVAIRTPGVSNDKFLLEQRRPHGGVDRPHNPLDASFYCRAFPKATAGIFVLSWKPGKTQ